MVIVVLGGLRSDNYQIIYVSGLLTINAIPGNFPSIAARNVVYTPTLKLADVPLPAVYLWKNGNITLNAGSGQIFEAIFIHPSGLYEQALGNITVHVARADPMVTWPSYGIAKEGEWLLSVSIAGGTGAGEFTWTTPENPVGGIGEQSHSITFTPDDTVNYNILTHIVTVKVEASTSVSLLDRRISDVLLNEEIAMGAPALTGEFTVGPNPVLRSSGTVKFYRQGKRVYNAVLIIYDASGNVVKKVSINDKTVSTQARRQVGVWDLTDMRGRRVGKGTYLAKGIITTSDSKKEMVSVIIGIR